MSTTVFIRIYIFINRHSYTINIENNIQVNNFTPCCYAGILRTSHSRLRSCPIVGDYRLISLTQITFTLLNIDYGFNYVGRLQKLNKSFFYAPTTTHNTHFSILTTLRRTKIDKKQNSCVNHNIKAYA